MRKVRVGFVGEKYHEEGVPPHAITFSQVFPETASLADVLTWYDQRTKLVDAWYSSFSIDVIEEEE